MVDTPDISNVGPLQSDPAESGQPVSLWKALTQPGPDVILLTVRCDVRYTAEEHAVYRQIKTLWANNDHFCRRLVVAFTFGDHQDENLEGELRDVCWELKSVLKDAGNRYVLFNNKAQLMEKKTAVKELLSMIDSTGKISVSLFFQTHSGLITGTFTADLTQDSVQLFFLVQCVDIVGYFFFMCVSA